MDYNNNNHLQKKRVSFSIEAQQLQRLRQLHEQEQEAGSDENSNDSNSDPEASAIDNYFDSMINSATNNGKKSKKKNNDGQFGQWYAGDATDDDNDDNSGDGGGLYGQLKQDRQHQAVSSSAATTTTTPTTPTNNNSNLLSLLTFLETRRRSHAFSISAIDETLQIDDMDYDMDEHCEPTESNGVHRSPPNHLHDIESGGGRSNSSKAPKLFRHSEIPINDHNRILLTQQHNEIMELKRFRSEVRALRDVEGFLEDPKIVLDVDKNTIEEVLDDILQLFSKALKPEVIAEARTQLFAARSAGYCLGNIVQNLYHTDTGQFLHDPTWFCSYASLSRLKTRRVAIARLKTKPNFGPTLRSVEFIILVLVPSNEKASKSAEQVARSFATLFTDSSLRKSLSLVENEAAFADTLSTYIGNIRAKFEDVPLDDRNALTLNSTIKKNVDLNSFKSPGDDDDSPEGIRFRLTFGRGIMENFRRRAGFYLSDYVDGIQGDRTALKVSGAILSLFFACILPCVAFGVVNKNTTKDQMGPKQALIGQAIGGLFFALFSGQPLVIIATTAPLCLYTGIVFSISTNIGVEFFDLFAAVGLWNGFFMILYSLFDLSTLMRFCTRATEEIFATFIFFAFANDAKKLLVSSFNEHYYCKDINATLVDDLFRTEDLSDCSPARSILFLFLMFGTLTLALLLYNFSTTMFLTPVIRETISDYALPVAVVAFSFLSTVVFSSVKADSFEVEPSLTFKAASLSSLTVGAWFISMILGFALSILFFIDQNVSAALVSAPMNKLKKGDAYHWDLFIVAFLNIFLSIFGLPWMHGILPHSPMHARALADTVALNSPNGSRYLIVERVRENRISGIAIHVLIGIVVIFVSRLFTWIPEAVLAGLFLYCAVSTLRDNSFYERFLLFFTQQRAYPTTNYLRFCPQKSVHWFTTFQIVELCIICGFGFAENEYVQAVFPFIIGCLIPIRWIVLPRLFSAKHLAIIDNKHF